MRHLDASFSTLCNKASFIFFHRMSLKVWPQVPNSHYQHKSQHLHLGLSQLHFQEGTMSQIGFQAFSPSLTRTMDTVWGETPDTLTRYHPTRASLVVASQIGIAPIFECLILVFIPRACFAQGLKNGKECICGFRHEYIQ